MFKSHGQRKGQWLYNKIRFNYKLSKKPLDVREELADVLWDMTDKEFDKIMEEYKK